MTFPSVEGTKNWYTDDEKETLDLAHLSKIEESDAILVLNKDNYIGESTKREVKWAKMRNKLVFWLEVPEDANTGERPDFNPFKHLLTTDIKPTLPIR